MSAWLCGNKTLSLCVDVIRRDDFKEFDECGYACKDDDELISLLSFLNTKSLNCRYGESDEHILKDRGYVSLSVDDGQRYKSVHCYLYQTCECNDVCEHPLFKGLEGWCDVHDDEFEKDWGKYQWDIDK